MYSCIYFILIYNLIILLSPSYFYKNVRKVKLLKQNWKIASNSHINEASQQKCKKFEKNDKNIKTHCTKMF